MSQPDFDTGPAALKRLAATGRACDHCGTRINRWTTACYYDPRTDRAYCSTGGCAAAWAKAPKCVSCKQPCSPFDGTGRETLAENRHVCQHCSASKGELPEQPRLKKKRYAVVDPEDRQFAGKLTPGEVADVKAGPYTVIEKRTGFWQLVRQLPEGDPFVRSTSSVSPLPLLQKCAELNRAA